MFKGNLPLILVTWIAVLFVMVIARQRKGTSGTGLVLAFVLNLWMIHWAAAAIYLLPTYTADPLSTILGTEQSLYGIMAFAFGSLALTPVLFDTGILPPVRHVHTTDQRLPGAYLAFGVAFFGLVATILGSLPTVTAIISAGQALIVAGLSLCWWQAWKANNFQQMAKWLALSFLPPLLTLVTRGFFGAGVGITLAVLVFISTLVRSRITVVIIGFLLGFVAISAFVTYMRDRGEIRATVWGGQSVSDRFEQIQRTMSSFEWFDPTNSEHLERIDSRLNQSMLVGAAIRHLQETGEFARGETLIDAALALVPRALWPDKPITAGSGRLVSRFTGIQFERSTSVGIGQVMEFYVNFGTEGVLIGFAILGLIVTTLDSLAAERLNAGDLHGFVLCYLPGLSFLQVGGQLVEVTATAAGSIVVVLLVNRYLDRLQRKSDSQRHADVDWMEPTL